MADDADIKAAVGRRRALQTRLIPSETLKRLYVRSDAEGALRLAGHVAVLLAGGWLIWLTRGTWWMLPAMLLHGFAVVALFAAMHECTHYTAFASRRLNEIVGAFAGTALLYNSTYYRHFHTVHHRYTQDPERDPELLLSREPRSALEFWWRVSAIPFWLLRLSQLVKLPLNDFRGLDFLPAPVRPQIVQSARIQVLLLLPLVALSIAFQNAAILWYWLVPALLANPFLRLYLMAEHGGCSNDNDGLANTRTTATIWPVRFLMWNMPFHAEHHLNPNIPFHALPQAHAVLAPHLVVRGEDGYAGVMRRLYRAWCKPAAAA
jgi:fatty acid desaturase